MLGYKQPLQEEGNIGGRLSFMNAWRPNGPAFQVTGHDAMLEAQQQSRLKAVKMGGTAAQVPSEPFCRHGSLCALYAGAKASASTPRDEALQTVF
jgi:hypothetical protein